MHLSSIRSSPVLSSFTLSPYQGSDTARLWLLMLVLGGKLGFLNQLYSAYSIHPSETVGYIKDQSLRSAGLVT